MPLITASRIECSNDMEGGRVNTQKMATYRMILLIDYKYFYLWDYNNMIL